MAKHRGLGADPWVEALLPTIIDEIEANVAPNYLPKWNYAEDKYQQYGCGYYGCVLPTHTKGVVLKLTTDPTEVLFVTNALLGDQDITRGMVRYHAIRQVLGGWHREHFVYAIWREEITPWVGTAAATKKLDALYDPLSQIYSCYRNTGTPFYWMRLLHRAAELEDEARAQMRRAPGHGRYTLPWVQFTVHDTADEYALKVAKLLVYLDQELRALPETPAFFDAMRAYYEHGWLFADVRADNVGQRWATSERPAELVIADPGHAVPLREEAFERFDANRPPLLGRGPHR